MILVTGGLGFIGANTTKALINSGETCVVTQYQNSVVPPMLQQHVGQQLFIEQADVTNIKTLEDIGSTYGITHIVHLAAPKFGALDIIDDMRANMQGLLNVFQIGRQWKVKRLVVTSSIGVYDGIAPPLEEDSRLSLSGANPIAANKKSFEIMGDAVHHQADLDIVFVRPSAIWGPFGQPRSMFFALPQMVYAAVQGDTSKKALGELFAQDGIDMCYVKDCGRAIALLAVAPTLHYNTYNIGSGYVATNQEIAKAIQQAIPQANFALTEGRNPQNTTENLYANVERLHQDVRFQPEYDLAAGIAEYAAWIRETL